MNRKTTLAVTLAAATFTAALAVSAPAAPVSPNSVIHVTVTGKGPDMLLIPGLGCSGDVWNGVVARFKDRYTCHVVTLGGFAGQPRYAGPFLDTARDALLAYAKREKLRTPVVVGHSLGGVLALEMAIAAPDLVGRVVILDALPFLGGAQRPGTTAETARAAMQPMRDMIRNQTQDAYAAFQMQSPYLAAMVTGPADLARVRDWAMRSDHTSIADAMFETGTTDLRDAVAGIHAPVLVLGTWYGAHEYVTRAAIDSTFRAQYAKLPQCTIALADSARHFVMLDAPEWTFGRMDAFLAEAPVATQRKDIRH